MERNISNISLIKIQQQINAASLQQLQEYAKVLATNDPKTIDDFLFDATHKRHGTKRMELCGDGGLY